MCQGWAYQNKTSFLVLRVLVELQQAWLYDAAVILKNLFGSTILALSDRLTSPHMLANGG